MNTKLSIKILYYNYSRNIFFISTLIFLAACASTSTSGHIRMYPGSITRPDSDIVKLLVPYELEILDIDGIQPEIPFIPNGSYRIDLLPGEHVITVFYKEFWGTISNGSVTESKVFQFKYSMLAGEAYLLKHNAPQDLRTANFDMLGSDIKVWLQSRDSSKVIQAFISGAKDNFVNRLIGKVISTNNHPENSQKDQFEQLKHWWKMADDKQRKAFTDWVTKRSLDGKGFESKNKVTIQHNLKRAKK